MRRLRWFTFIPLCFLVYGCGANIATVKKPPPGSYTVFGKTYTPMKTVQRGHTESGTASWYGPGFHGKKTASGEVYDMHELTAAHSILPLHSVVRVKNLRNDKEVVVRINDRGPFVGERVIDLSLTAARSLDMVGPGIAPVRVTVLVEGKPVMLAKKKNIPVQVKEAPAPNPFYRRWAGRILALRWD
jgi:rare lipoprotein A